MTTPKGFVVILVVASVVGLGLYRASVIRRQGDELTQREGNVAARHAALTRTPAAPSQALDAALPRDPGPSGTTSTPDERIALLPAFAQLDYIREHAGQRPADPDLLRPYLARPFDPATLREWKLKWDGEHLSMTYSWSN